MNPMTPRTEIDPIVREAISYEQIQHHVRDAHRLRNQAIAQLLRALAALPKQVMGFLFNPKQDKAPASRRTALSS